MRDIQRDSIHMCNLASETLQDVMDAVRRRDFTVVERVLEQDQRIRSMRMALNERVMRMIATQHPVAVDLRRLFYIIHLADEMERIGYQAAAIGRCILRTQYGKVLLLEDIYRMSERTATMFERMLASSLNESTDAVRNVLTMDDEVDVLYEQIYRECITRQSGPALAGQRRHDRCERRPVHRARGRPHRQLGALVALLRRGAGQRHHRLRPRAAIWKQGGPPPRLLCVGGPFFSPLGRENPASPKIWVDKTPLKD